jgi:hypothetical protein
MVLGGREGDHGEEQDHPGQQAGYQRDQDDEPVRHRAERTSTTGPGADWLVPR